MIIIRSDDKVEKELTAALREFSVATAADVRCVCDVDVKEIHKHVGFDLILMNRKRGQ